MYGYVLGTVCVFARNIHGELHYIRAISLKSTSETTGERNETTLAAIDEENSVNGAKRSWKSSIFPLRTGRAERIRQKTERQADNGTETGLKSVQSPLAAFLPIPNYEWNRSCKGSTTITGISSKLRALLMSRRHCFCFPDSRQFRVCPARHERFSPRRCCSRRRLTPPEENSRVFSSLYFLSRTARREDTARVARGGFTRRAKGRRAKLSDTVPSRTTLLTHNRNLGKIFMHSSLSTTKFANFPADMQAFLTGGKPLLTHSPRLECFSLFPSLYDVFPSTLQLTEPRQQFSTATSVFSVFFMTFSEPICNWLISMAYLVAAGRAPDTFSRANPKDHIEHKSIIRHNVNQPTRKVRHFLFGKKYKSLFRH